MRLLIVGAGGIGSWFARYLSNAVESNQFGAREAIKIIIVDYDDVEEKNLRYQDFTEEDLYDNKAYVMSNRYRFDHKVERVTDLNPYTNFDYVISCVDNTTFRDHLFNSFHTVGPYWIDMRSEGTSIALFTKHKKNSLDTLLSTIPKEVKSGSCQRADDLKTNTIQHGNVIVSAIGIQFLLNHFRRKTNPPNYIHNF